MSWRGYIDGPVSAGRPYIVGERGPELFVSPTAGAIKPAGTFGGGGINLHITLEIDGRTIWESVRRYSAEEIRRLGGY